MLEPERKTKMNRGIAVRPKAGLLPGMTTRTSGAGRGRLTRDRQTAEILKTSRFTRGSNNGKTKYSAASIMREANPVIHVVVKQEMIDEAELTVQSVSRKTKKGNEKGTQRDLLGYGFNK